MNGSFFDPDPSDTHTVVVTWGDGTPNQNISVAAGVLTFSATHTYVDGANPSTRLEGTAKAMPIAHFQAARNDR